MERNKPNEIYITRLYDASVKLVWDAWTDPQKVAKWWGPRGFTITTHSKDLRVGGHWSYTMYGPDGAKWENKTIYHEVEVNKRLVYDHGGNDDRPPLFRVTVEFSEQKGKTKMDMTMALATPEAAKETIKFIKLAGGNSTWDRLAEYLEKESSGKEKFVINRSFEANIDKVFSMWTDMQHFSKWLGPKGMDMEIFSGKVAEGESPFYKMSGSGVTLYGKIHYLKIQKPNLLIYTQQFADEHGKVSRHPMMPTWPETMKTTVLFAEEGPQLTRVTVEWEVGENSTAEEIQAFVNERGGMTQGWTGSFDKLEEALAKS